jgi:hypothetical protein
MALTIDDFGRLQAKKRGTRGFRAAALNAGVSPATFLRVENGHMPEKMGLLLHLVIWM